MHLYSTPHSMSWIIFTDAGAGGLEWSGPAAYVKIRDGLYHLLAGGGLQRHAGHHRGQPAHDARCGDRLSLRRRGPEHEQLGAHARHAGRFDVKRFYQLKT